MDRPCRHTVPTLVVYGDFNCPFSAIASSRLERLEADGFVHVEWRCVEHDPTIGPHETPLTGQQHAAFAAELDQIRRLLASGEPDRLLVPSRRLNSRDLNLTYAGAPVSQRSALRSCLFAAYWQSDLDLTDATVVDGLVRTVSASTDGPASSARIPNAEQATSAMRAWQTQWRDLGRPVVPMMVLPDGYVSRGLGALARLIDGSWSRPASANAR